MLSIRDILETVLDSLVDGIRGNIKKTGRYATGKTSKAIRNEIEENENLTTGKLFAPDYINELEIGVPAKFNIDFRSHGAKIIQDIYVRDLTDWAAARGLTKYIVPISRKLIREGSYDYRHGIVKNIYSKELINVKNNLNLGIKNTVMDIIAYQLNKLTNDSNSENTANN